MRIPNQTGKISWKVLAAVGLLVACLAISWVNASRRAEARHARAAQHLKKFSEDLQLYEAKYHAEPADSDSLKRAGTELLKDEFAMLRACPDCGKPLTYNIPGFGTGKPADPAATPADWPMAWHDCPLRESEKVEVVYPKGRVELVDRAAFAAGVAEHVKRGDWKPWEPTRE